MGYGSGPYGEAPWGDGLAVSLVSVESIAENVIRLTFDGPVLATGLEVAGDALDERLYTITPVDGIVGLDGAPARPVLIAMVRLAEVADVIGEAFDLTLDRAMSPWPCNYIVTVDGVMTPEGGSVSGSGVVLAQRKGVVPIVIDQTTGSRDIAITSGSIA